MDLFIVIFFTALFIFISWLLDTLVKGDVRKIFKWAKYLYIILLSFSCILWIFESVKTGKWLDVDNVTVLMLIFNLISVILLILIYYFWIAFSGMWNRKYKGIMKYGIRTYPNRTSEYYYEISQGRLISFLTYAIIIVPILNIWLVIKLIKTYFI